MAAQGARSGVAKESSAVAAGSQRRGRRPTYGYPGGAMSDEAPGPEPVSRSGSRFPTSRRGYDRDAVDRHAADVEARLAALEDERNRLAAQLAALGVDDGGDLRSELEQVGADVQRVLDEARAAAEAVRSRAADDAARWRSAAETTTPT